ncbi:MAG: general stress protein [Hydrococcus sp. Prado102]|jgi:hypothetical protein|nr:general stress protein [Hydrococcus sp. Prado102]
MVTQQYKRAVGTFSSKREAQAALNELRNSGFAMDKISVLAKDTDRNEQVAGIGVTDRDDIKDRGDTEAQEGAGIGATAGTVLGGAGGLLVGLEALIIPGVGPFLAAGTIATTLAGAGIGAAAGAIVGALTGLGIPEEDAKAYDQRISQGDYLVILEGTEAEIDRAGSILRNGGVRQWNVYNIADGRSSASGVAPTPMNKPAVDRPMANTSDRITTDEPEVKIIDRRDET